MRLGRAGALELLLLRNSWRRVRSLDFVGGLLEQTAADQMRGDLDRRRCGATGDEGDSEDEDCFFHELCGACEAYLFRET